VRRIGDRGRLDPLAHVVDLQLDLGEDHRELGDLALGHRLAQVLVECAAQVVVVVLDACRELLELLDARRRPPHQAGTEARSQLGDHLRCVCTRVDLGHERVVDQPEQRERASERQQHNGDVAVLTSSSFKAPTVLVFVKGVTLLERARTTTVFVLNPQYY